MQPSLTRDATYAVCACRSDLLCPSPRPASAPAGGTRMFLDENHQRALQTYSGRSNTSSMKGAGVNVVAEVRPMLAYCRGCAGGLWLALSPPGG